MQSIETINRRTLLKASAAFGGSLLLPMGLARAQQPKKGGHLVMGIDGASTTQSLDPATFAQSYDQNVGLQIYNTLINPITGGLEGALAESWESTDSKKWVLKLRKGVLFHNSKEMGPADVIYSLNHHRGENSKSAAKPLMENVASIETGGPNEVVLTLKTPDADLPYILAAVHMCIVPEGSNFTDGIGTGPFVLERFDPGVKTQVKRNPSYWRSDRAFVDSVETIAINDPTARINALIAGECHLINRPEPRLAKQLEGVDGITLYNISGRGFNCLTMNTQAGPFSNNDLRLAMKNAMPRKKVIDSIANGYGTIGNDHPVPPTDPYYAADLPQRESDPDKAAFHFKKAGITDTLTLTTSEVYSGANDAVLLLQAAAETAGIKTTVDKVPTDAYMDNVFGKAALSPNYWNGRPTANMIMTLAYQSDAPWNAGHFKDAQFDQLLLAGRSELDEGKRRQIYHDLQTILYERGSDITFMFFNVLDAGSTKVKGFEPMAIGELSALRAAEKVWFE